MVLMQPEFLIALDAFSENTIEENRRWVFHLPTHSLVEFFPLHHFAGITHTKFPIEKNYRLSGQEASEYKAILMQGSLTGEDAYDLLDKCWIAYQSRIV